jgi:hypothetical protein
MRLICREIDDPNRDFSVVRIPRSCILLTDNLDWEDRDDFLSLTQQPADFTRLQIELLDLHIELYNALGKIPWLSHYHPDPLLMKAPTLLRAVQQVKPGADPTFFTLAQRFIQTRNFSIHCLQPEHQPSKSSGIIPILDCMNHSHQGLSLICDEDDVLLNHDLGSQGREYFLNYGGHRDVIDLALSMAYFDKFTPFFSSSPVDIEIPEIGSVTVEGLNSSTKHALDPPRTVINEAQISLSHITGNLSSPHSFKVAIDLVIQGFLGKNKRTIRSYNKISSAVRERIVSINVELLENLCIQAKKYSPTWPSADLLVKASSRQKSMWLSMLN